MFRQDRNKNGGGVLTYIRDNLKPVHLSSIQEKAVNEGLEVTISLIEIRKERKHAIIIGIYRPPNARICWFQAFNSLLLETRKKGYTIILGDINSDLLKPDVYPAKELLNSLYLAGAQHIVEGLLPTRVTIAPLPLVLI